MPTFIDAPFKPGIGVKFRSQQSPDLSPVVTAVTPAIGKASGGTSVTITGRNFIADGAGTIDVRFDGLLATSIVVVNRTTITCVTPAGMTVGSVDITVKNAQQTVTGTLFDAFQAYDITITAIDPNHGPISGGTVITIYGVGFELGSTVTFDDVAATNVIFIDSQHMKATAPAHATGFVSVKVIGP